MEDVFPTVRMGSLGGRNSADGPTEVTSAIKKKNKRGAAERSIFVSENTQVLSII